MGLRLLGLLMLSSLSLTGGGGAQDRATEASYTDDLSQRLATIAERYIQSEELESLSVAISIGAERLYDAEWGEVDPDRDTILYRSGALTEPLLAHAILLLERRGELAIDDPLTKHLPKLEPLAEGVTLAHLLAHTSGLPAYGDLLASQGAKTVERTTIETWLAGMSLEFEPGTCSTHSNTNPLLLGWILEDLTGIPVPAALAKLVFEPSGMEDTLYCHEGPELSEVAEVSQEFGAALITVDSPAQPFWAEGLCTTASDLERWWSAIRERDTIDESGYAHLTTPWRMKDGSQASNACGMNVTKLAEFQAFSCGGGLGGSRVHLAYYPDMDLTLAVLARNEFAPVARIERSLARVILGVPEPGVQDLTLSADEKPRYLGEYYVGCNRYLIEDHGERLHVVPPIGRVFSLRYQGNHVFLALDDPEVRLAFHLEGETAHSFTLEEHGTIVEAEKFQEE